MLSDLMRRSWKIRAIAAVLFVVPIAVSAQAKPTDGCLPLNDCTRQGGTSQGQSFCQRGSVYCRGYTLGSDITNSSAGAGGAFTNNPCGAAGVSQGKTTVCVATEADCAESPISAATSLCESNQLCCVKKAAAVTPSSAPASGGSVGSVSLPDPLGGVTLPVLIGNAIRAFAGIAGAIALLMFVYGGITWIISGGDQKKIASSQKILKNAAIGLVLIFGAYFFVATIISGILTNPPSGT